MATYEEIHGDCTPCKKKLLLKRRGINHILHIILSVISMGFWLVIWGLLALNREKWLCSGCGSFDVAVPPAPMSSGQKILIGFIAIIGSLMILGGLGETITNMFN